MIYVEPWDERVIDRDVGFFGMGLCLGCGAAPGRPHSVINGRECWRLLWRLAARVRWIGRMHLRARDPEIEHAKAASSLGERDRLIEELKIVGRFDRAALLAAVRQQRDERLEIEAHRWAMASGDSK